VCDIFVCVFARAPASRPPLTTRPRALLKGYYSRADIRKSFPGGVRRFEAAPKHHPSSIMPLSSTGASGGRGKQTGDIIGTVINHGKKVRVPNPYPNTNKHPNSQT
jgi:hypothetical protein